MSILTKDQESYIDHEVRMRLVENKFPNIDSRFDNLESKLDLQFHWVLGTILAQIALIITLFGGVILHIAKLI